MPAFRPRRADLALAAALAVVGAAEHLAGREERWPLGLAAYLCAAGALALARAAPLALPPAAGLLYLLAAAGGFDVAQPVSWLLLLPAAFFLAGLHAPRERWPLGLAGLAATLGLVLAALVVADFEPSLLFGLAATGGPWALGLLLRTALDREAQAGAVAERARVEREAARERAVTAERERIAGELQDVLAHALGAMVLQASAAGDLVRREPRDASRLLLGVAGAGREALAETGRLLRVLREEQPASGRPAPAAAGAAARPPLGVRDAALPLLFGVVGTAEVAASGYGPAWALLGAVWLACALLVARRRVPAAMPLGVTGVFLATLLVGGEADELASTLPILALAYFAAGRHLPRRRLAVGLAAVLAAATLSAVEVLLRGEFAADVLLLLAFALALWGIGVALRTSLARTRRLAAEAERARLEAGAGAAEAVSADRRRIARELHDLLAGSLSVMSVQAALAAELVAADPARAAEAVAEVERAGRSALEDGGRLLRLVHDGADGTTPQPGLADLPALADDCARAGLEVELEDGPVGRVPAGVALSAYRIVQEALLNARKHAPGSRVHVRVARSPSEVAIEVVNGRPGAPAPPPVPSGHGLAGVRERVALYGGSLDARPTPEGGFALSATIPIAEDA